MRMHMSTFSVMRAGTTKAQAKGSQPFRLRRACIEISVKKSGLLSVRLSSYAYVASVLTCLPLC